MVADQQGAVRARGARTTHRHARARARHRRIARDELGGYLEHRLHLSGCELPLFEPATVEAIHQAAGGLPHKVNLLAHDALFAAAIAKAKTINTEHVQTALQEVA